MEGSGVMPRGGLPQHMSYLQDQAMAAAGYKKSGKDQEAGAITRADVAAFCLDAVLEEDFDYVKQAPCISSDKGSGFDSVLADKTKSRMGQQ
mgnify:CR=1 FL=1